MPERAGDTATGVRAAPGTVTFADVEAAEARLRGKLVPTPLAWSQTLSAMTGAHVTLKFENLQFTASFKERGALNRLLLLSDDERRRGVIAVSAGNHAQGVARHGALLGIPVTIVMPETVAATKMERTRALGADVVCVGSTLEEAMEVGTSRAVAQGLTMIHPYDDPAVIAGQGTVAIEILRDDPATEVLLVPVGGGGLIAGVATAVKHLSPAVEVVGVQSEHYAGMAAALTGAAAGDGGPSVADGIAVREPGALPLAIARALVDDVVTVSEESIETAIGTYLEVEKVLAEGAGAAPLAALLEHPERFGGRHVALIVSGGNIDLRYLADVIVRDLHRSGRLVWLHLEVLDSPGTLAQVSKAIASCHVNILQVVHRRYGATLPSKGAFLDVYVETTGSEQLDEVVSLLSGLGYAVTTDTETPPL